jgi:iron complex outermembrane receptor protein
VVRDVWLDAFVFARQSDELVAFRRASFGSVRPFNVGAARVLGAELAAGVDALRHARVGASVTALDPRDVSRPRALQSDLLPFMSRLVAMEELELYAEPALPALEIERASVLARLSHRSSRVADPAGLIVLAEQHVFDVEAALFVWDGHVALRVALENVFDRGRFDVVGFPLPGRRWHAAAEVWLW